MSQFRDMVGRLVDQTEREIVALYQRHIAGSVSQEQLVVLSAALLARARTQGVALADLSLTAEASRFYRAIQTPVGVTLPEGDFERLQESVGSVLSQVIEGAETPEQLSGSRQVRLARLGRDSAAEAAVWGMGVAGAERGLRGWTRETSARACPICVGLADGVVRPFSVVMKRHTGCACVQAAAFA